MVIFVGKKWFFFRFFWTFGPRLTSKWPVMYFKWYFLKSSDLFTSDKCIFKFFVSFFDIDPDGQRRVKKMKISNACFRRFSAKKSKVLEQNFHNSPWPTWPTKKNFDWMLRPKIEKLTWLSSYMVNNKFDIEKGHILCCI